MTRPRGAPHAIAGAAFLMATSAIGPGFLTQTTVFTDRLRADFAFAILASVLIDLAVQVNVWRVLGVARRRGQELASALVPGLGPALALVVAFGGLAFNVGNLAGSGLGLAVFGVPAPLGAALSAAVALVLLARPGAGHALDRFVQVLGVLMLLLTAVVVASTRPDVGEAVHRSVLPQRIDALSVITLVGGTVGGYITFSGVHRLLDAGIGGVEDLARLTRASVVGILVTGLMRVLLFLAVLGVVSAAAGSLDPANPPASAFRLGAGEWGYRFFGLVLWSASITSVVGCTYTTFSFLRTLHASLERRFSWGVAAFLALSFAIFVGFGQPVRLLILAGALNGLILPATLGVVLLAARRPALTPGYRHPLGLQLLGWLAFVVSLVAGGVALASLRGL